MSSPNDPLRPLEPLEIALGRVLESPGPVPEISPQGSPRQVLEDLIASCLEAGPVSVSFSGGRDSSLILAVATHVARREGFADPLPVTLRHDSPTSREDEWQQLVVDHLGLREWVRFDVGDELDILGPRATSVLQRFGIQSPPNAYLHLAMLERAHGGTMLTGAGGDEILATKGNHLARGLWGDGPLWGRRQAQSALLAVAPAPVRRRWKRREVQVPRWLTPEARRAAAAHLARTAAQEGVRWDRLARRYAGSRLVLMGQRALSEVGSACGMRVESPLLDQRFVAAFARGVGAAGPVNRAVSMHALAADVLPRAVIERSTKAVFSAVVWGPAFREFCAQGDLSGVSSALGSLVDLDQVLAQWRSPSPDFTSAMILQDAWLGVRRT